MAEASFIWPDGKELALSISLDDGRASQVDAALPILEEAGAKATFYVVPANAEKKLDGWRAVAAAGHEIGNHSVFHPCTGNFGWAREKALEDYTLDKMEAELLECNRLLHEMLGVAPRTFGYPCGQTFVGRGENTRSYVPIVAKHFLAGRVYMSEWHNDPQVCDLAHLLGRPCDNTPLEVLKEWIETARRESGWLVLAGHDVGDDSKPQTMNASGLRELCKFALDPANGIWLDTVESIAWHIKKGRNQAANDNV